MTQQIILNSVYKRHSLFWKVQSKQNPFGAGQSVNFEITLRFFCCLTRAELSERLGVLLNTVTVPAASWVYRSLHNFFRLDSNLTLYFKRIIYSAFVTVLRLRGCSTWPSLDSLPRREKVNPLSNSTFCLMIHTAVSRNSFFFSSALTSVTNDH